LKPRVALALGALLLFALQARQSAGYYHFDEYFQTVEFASYKLGITPPGDLPWEFAARMRPFLQPAVYYGIAGALGQFGPQEPGVALLAFRLFDALLAWASLCLLAWALGRRLQGKRAKTWLLASCLLTWFVPFLSVRTSSENLAGSLLAMGFASFLLLEKRLALAALTAGAAMGLSFEARYQVAFAVLGFVAWLLLLRRAPRALLPFAVGFALSLALGLAIDRWGYGEWVATPWNYLRVNLVEERAAAFGRSPVTFFVTSLVTVHAPLSALLLLAAVLFWVRAPRDPITWMTLPFVVGHTLFAHKELRFLFPLGPLAAAIPALLLLDPSIDLARFRGFLARRPGILRGLVALNLAFLGALLVVPIRHDLSVQVCLHRKLASATDPRVVFLATEPFVDGDVPLRYLQPPGLRPIRVAFWQAVEPYLEAADGPLYVVARIAEPPPAELRERYQVRRLTAPLPEGVARLLARPLQRTEMRALWSVERREALEVSEDDSTGPR